MQTGALSVLVAALTLPLPMQPGAADELAIDEQDKHPPLGEVVRDGGGVAASPHASQESDTRRFPERGIGFWHGDHPARRAHHGTGGSWFFFHGPSPYPASFSLQPPLHEAPLTPGYGYYCDDPPGYYPRVAECHTPWRAAPRGDPPPP